MFLQNVGYLHTSPHGVTTQKTNIDMMIFWLLPVMLSFYV
jgi:hypothetical protein